MQWISNTRQELLIVLVFFSSNDDGEGRMNNNETEFSSLWLNDVRNISIFFCCCFNHPIKQHIYFCRWIFFFCYFFRDTFSVYTTRNVVTKRKKIHMEEWKETFELTKALFCCVVWFDVIFFVNIFTSEMRFWVKFQRKKNIEQHRNEEF